MQYVYLVGYGKDRVKGQKDKLVGRRNFCFEGTQNWRIGAVLLGALMI